MIKTIIFDYGKVIGNDSSSYIYKAVSKKFRINKNKIKKEFFKFIFLIEKGKIPEIMFWKRLAKNLNIHSYEILRKVWVEEFKKRAKVNKNLLSLISKLKHHYKICLLSNNAIFYQKDSINEILKKVFPVIIYSYNVKMRKPEKRIYMYTIRRMKSKPEECLAIDDSKAKLACPKKIGIETIRFKSLSMLRKDLLKKLDNQKINKILYQI
jgi:putative hydrolase of the HAD superfamily